MLYGLLSHYNRAANTLVAMGNHDLNRGEYATPDAIARHNLFLRSYTGAANDKPYYSMKIGDCTFIVLGDEEPQEDTTAVISQTQLDWLKKTMDDCSAGFPVFIFLHQSLNYTFAKDNGWGFVGEQSEAIREIIENRGNVFFFNGHLHRSFGIKQENEVTYINLPTLLSGGMNGIGCQVEYYSGKVILRARNYITGQWLDDGYEVMTYVK
jgi:hypothetical protein